MPLTHRPSVCVYGGTSGGVIAAVQVARMGKRVARAEPGEHLGGMSSGGLGWTDFGNKSAIGGLAHDVYRRVGTHYGKPVEYNLEPHDAEAVFGEMVAEYRVPVRLRQRLASVQRAGPRIAAVTMDDGTTYRAAVFIESEKDAPRRSHGLEAHVTIGGLWPSQSDCDKLPPGRFAGWSDTWLTRRSRSWWFVMAPMRCSGWRCRVRRP